MVINHKIMDKIILQKQREYRSRTNNVATNKYEKTINGFLMRKYRNMESRIKGIQKVKYHLYRDLPILDRKTFYEWAKSSNQFYILYNDWVAHNFERKLTPSVDRINPLKGYELSNMEWVTHSENSRRGAKKHKMKI